MTALVDTNVILDVLLARTPFLTSSAAVLAAVENSRCRGLLCASTITTIHYVARRQIGTAGSLARISSLLLLFDIALVNKVTLLSALHCGFSDFEDAVLHESAFHAGATCIVTRNVSDFKNARVLVYDPVQFLEALRLSGR